MLLQHWPITDIETKLAPSHDMWTDKEVCDTISSNLINFVYLYYNHKVGPSLKKCLLGVTLPVGI